jgi:hypothetical protein
VLVLVKLVTNGIGGSVGTSAERGIRVLGNLYSMSVRCRIRYGRGIHTLVGLLGSTRGGFVDLVSNVVGSVPVRTC